MADLDILVGTKIRLRAIFRQETDPNIVPTSSSPVADPTEVFFTIRLPNGTEIEYEYGVDAELQKEGVGRYYVEYTPIVPFQHKVIWKGTGAVEQVQTLSFYAEPV